MPQRTNNPLFDNAPGGVNDPRLPDTIAAFISQISAGSAAAAPAPSLDSSLATHSQQVRVDAVKNMLKSRLDTFKQMAASRELPRAHQFLPYLLVRNAPGDRGDRPLGVLPGGWQSTDIWIAPGLPAAAPEIPPDRGPNPIFTEGNYTIYAHVWNLGRAPVVGAKVEFYATPGYGDEEPSPGEPLGMARIDLPPRSSLGCHRLVKCPNPWWAVSQLPNGGRASFYYLLVRVSAIGDPIGSNPWDPSQNRHVAKLAVDMGHLQSN